MNKFEKRKNSLLKCEEKAYKYLESLNMLEEYHHNKMINRSICTSKTPHIDYSNCKNENIYQKNCNCFTFKLVDKSIIYYKIDINSNGEIIKSNYCYFSYLYNEDSYTNIIEYLSSEQVDNLPQSQDDCMVSQEELEDYILRCYLKNKKLNDSIIENILKLSRNMVSIRVDSDKNNSTQNHPLNHLTLNGIKNSRFKISNTLSIYDFVCFILDLVYGEKNNEGQYIVAGSL